MVGYLPHCTFNLNPRAASIDTPLHAYVPKKHVDHMHPDAIIAIAASEDSRRLTEKIFGDEIGWLPWKRPGYELGLWLEKFCAENPDARKAWCWKATACSPGRIQPGTCYETDARDHQQGHRLVRGAKPPDKPAFGGAKASRPLAAVAERRAVAARLMPVIRGMISLSDEHKVGHFDDSEAVLQFVCSERAWKSSPRSAPAAPTISCAPRSARWCSISIPPSRYRRDARRPARQLDAYRDDYAAYYERCRRPTARRCAIPMPSCIWCRASA